MSALLKIRVITISLLFAVNSLTAQELYKLNLLPINTPDKNEFSVIPFEDKLLFCSDRSDFSSIKFETVKGAKSLINIFLITSDSSKNLQNAETFSSIYAHDGPISFYEYGTKAVLTRTQNDKTKFKSLYKDTKLGIFFFEKIEGKWIETKPFTFNDASYSCGQATINEQGTVMVFSSDMPGSLGGTDLFYTTYNSEDSTWTLPVNLGPVINSTKNEMFPFLHPSGILYYSSAGKRGKGGLDVFHTVGGYPYTRIVHEVDDINSEKDDFGFWASADFSKGYISSNRAGSDDIYSVKLSYPEFTDCVDYVDVNYCYEFFEEASIGIDTIPMVYEWDFGDGNSKKGLSAYHCYREPGNYTVQLNVFDTVINTLFMNEALYQLEIPDYNQPLMDMPDSANPMMPFFVSAGQARFRDFQIGAYYWDFGDGMQMKGERFPVTLEKPGVYEVILGVTSVPDAYGHTTTKCFKKKIIVTDEVIERPLADDSSDPATEKLPGGTKGTTYVLIEDSEGYHVKRIKADETNTSSINQLPNAVYYVKLDDNGDTISKKHSQDRNTLKLLENYLQNSEAPYEVKKNGLVSYNAFLPNDSLKYPVYGLDIKNFYGSIDSLVKSPWQFTLLPGSISNALQQMNMSEAGLTFVNKAYDSKYLPKYNASIGTTDENTLVFYKQLTTDPNKANQNNTSQYNTEQYNGNFQNNTTNNVNNTNAITQNQNTGNLQNNSSANIANTNKTENNNSSNQNLSSDQNKFSVNNKDSSTNSSINTALTQNQNLNEKQNNNSENSTNNKENTTTSNETNKDTSSKIDLSVNDQQKNDSIKNTINDTKTLDQNNIAQSNNNTVSNSDKNNTVEIKDTLTSNEKTDTSKIDTTSVTSNDNYKLNKLESTEKDSALKENTNQESNLTLNLNNNTDNQNNDSKKNSDLKYEKTNNSTLDNSNNKQNVNNKTETVLTQPDKNNDSNKNNGVKTNKTFNAEKPLTKQDSLALDSIRALWKQFLNFSHPDLYFKVQIGAYRYPKNFNYNKIKELSQGDEQLKLEDDITRITVGKYSTLNEAYEIKGKVKDAGVKDAFVTAVYKNKRYQLSEIRLLLKEIMLQNKENL